MGLNFPQVDIACETLTFAGSLVQENCPFVVLIIARRDFSKWHAFNAGRGERVNERHGMGCRMLGLGGI